MVTLVLAAVLSTAYDSKMAITRPFSDELRDAILRSVKTRYQISAETGVAQSVLSRFVPGKSGVSVASVDAVCECGGGFGFSDQASRLRQIAARLVRGNSIATALVERLASSWQCMRPT